MNTKLNAQKNNKIKHIKVSSLSIHGDCDILKAAMARYPQRIFTQASHNKNLNPTQRRKNRKESRKSLEAEPHFKGYLKTVQIVMKNKDGCEKYPYMDMDENCKQNIIIQQIHFKTEWSIQKES